MSAELQKHLLELSDRRLLPNSHIQYLRYLKSTGFEPKVIYDIGSCVLHWTREAELIWPSAKYILFDAFEPTEFLYSGYDYHMGVLSDLDGDTVKFYQNDYNCGGNSYYRELGFDNGAYFPADRYIMKPTTTLDSIVASRNFPKPDLIKIDVQGAELDIIKGAHQCIANAQHLIVEMQCVNYNDGAPQVGTTLPYIESLGWKCTAPLFSDNGPDGDYGFTKL